ARPAARRTRSTIQAKPTSRGRSTSAHASTSAQVALASSVDTRGGEPERAGSSTTADATDGTGIGISSPSAYQGGAAIGSRGRDPIDFPPRSLHPASRSRGSAPPGPAMAREPSAPSATGTSSRGPIPRRCRKRRAEFRASDERSAEGMKDDMGQSSWVSRIASLQDSKQYAELNWEGSFEDYLALVRQNPRVTRTAFQRIYEMILSHGRTEYIDNKKKLVRYHFFSDERFGGRDAIFGLDVPLMKLVNVFKSAAQGYGTERRVILLHGPVGSSKSTIARLLKKGIEEYSRTPDGAAYTFTWLLDKKQADGTVLKERMKCPMNEEPLNLVPREWRPKVFAELCPPESGVATPEGNELCPACRFVFRDLMTAHQG